MSVEITYLTWTVLFTALMWAPYILDRFVTWGIVPTLSYPESPPAQSPWAQRARKAHANAVENLVLFAALVLVVQVMGKTGDTAAMACIVYFWARVVHFGVYTLAIPYARTLAFVTGWVCQLVLVAQILA